MRVEQGRKGMETDGGGEGLSQQEVRRGGSRRSAGMEDTLGDVDITGHQEVLHLLSHDTAVHRKGLGMPAMLHASS